MISKTKFEIDPATIARLFDAAGIPGAQNIQALGEGEYNAVFSVSAGERKYVVKIAPDESVPVLTYEREIMASEVFWYGMMREQTSIRVPDVYFVDDTKTLVPVCYFIMEQLPGTPLHRAELTAEEKTACLAELAQMAAQMHKVKNDRYGYLQNALYDTWYEAIRQMTANLLADCKRKRRRSRRGERLLKEIDRTRAILENVPCCMVNFDIWEPNIIFNRENGTPKLAWIDPERSFWGDRMADFVCLDFVNPLEKKAAVLTAYNAATVEPVLATREETVRWAVMQAYLALIMETEKYYRYSLVSFGWWRNVLAAGMLYRSAFRALNEHR